MSQGTPSHGTLVKVGPVGGPYVQIGLCGDVDGIGYTRSSHDVADQTSNVIKVLPGVGRPAPVSVALALVNGSTEHDNLRADAIAGTLREYQVSFPTDIEAVPVAGPVFLVQCFVENLTWSNPNDGVVTGSCTLQPIDEWVES